MASLMGHLKLTFFCNVLPELAPSSSFSFSSSSSSSSSSRSFPVNHFDRLPDSVVVLIMGKLSDIKSLGKCRAVSRRFDNLAPEVESVVFNLDSVRESRATARFRFFQKPLESLRNLAGLKRTLPQGPSPPEQVLKGFRRIRHLSMVLPEGELGVEKGALLKWRADFGTTLDNCLLLGASSLDLPSLSSNISTRIRGRRRTRPITGRELTDHTTTNTTGRRGRRHPRPITEEEEEEEEGGELTGHTTTASSTRRRGRSPPRSITEEVDNEEQEEEEENYVHDSSIPQEPTCCNEIMQLRVIWTISSLIAASARHYLLHPIVRDHPNLESLVVTDADGQGTLCMGKEQLREYRSSPIITSSHIKRTEMPALSMRLCYAHILNLSNGYALHEATLTTIQPNNKVASGPIADKAIDAAFDGPFRCAVEKLMTKQTLLLEMNSF